MAGGFVLGEVLGLQNEVALCVTGMIGLTVVPLAVLCFGLRAKGRSLWLWLLPFFVCAGFWRGCDARLTCDRELALGLDGKYVTVTGEIIKREQRKDGSWRVVLRKAFGSQAAADFCLKRLQVYLDAVDSEDECPYRIGAKISLSGTIQSFDEARNPGEFDYRLYARSQKMNYRMFADDYTVTAAGSRPVRENLARFREWAGKILEQIADPEFKGYCHCMLYYKD